MPRQRPIKLLPHCSHRAKASACDDKRASYKVFDYDREDLNQSVVWTHKACVCNELVALRERHQLDTGLRYTAGETLVYDNFMQLVSRNGGLPTLKRNTFSQVISHYTGAKRKEYERGAESLAQDPLNNLDARVRMFLKDDKYHTFDFKAPRCIQFRNKRYGITLASYLQPIEEYIYSLEDESGSRVFAKGRNVDERASDLRQKWDDFCDPVALCLDHSKFDCHVSVKLLKQEHRAYQTLFPGDRCLKQLLKGQLVNKGSTRNGTVFKTTGTRMSGDQNTGLGNSILNYGMLAEFVKGVKARFYIDGDDSVVIVERGRVSQLKLGVFRTFGMNTKLEVVDEFEHIEFCQSRPVWDGVAWHMIRNPMRVIARLPWLVKRNHLNVIPRYLKSVGMCEMVLNLGIPVMQEIARTLISKGSGKYMKTDRHYLAKLSKIKPWNVKPVPIRQVTRESFEKAWGITIEEQMKLEKVSVVKPETNVVAILDQHLPSGLTL